MKNLFKVRKINRALREQYKLNLEIPKSNQVSFGTKSLRIQGPGIRTHYFSILNPKKMFRPSKYVIKFWDGSKCSYNICFNSVILKFCNIVYK